MSIFNVGCKNEENIRSLGGNVISCITVVIEELTFFCFSIIGLVLHTK